MLYHFNVDSKEITFHSMKRIMIEFVDHIQFYYWRVVDYSITNSKLKELFEGAETIPFYKFYSYILENDLEFYAEGVSI